MTRPGIAPIASGLLVEIFVSILQHPRGILAPAPLSHTEDRGLHPLGLVPHQIRGYLSNFQNILVKGMSYNCCSACSQNVINAYQSEGWSFVKRALNEQGFVEELSGLAQVSNEFYMDVAICIELKSCQVQRSAERALADLEWSEEEDDGDLI